MNEILSQKIKELPHNPGVYIMLDKDGSIIYIGKAKVLANRVRQYFLNLSSHQPKVVAMVSNICDFTYIITNTELDALSLEATLIKKHKPYYNILLKDDKAHPYIRIDTKQVYPTMEVVRRLKSDGAKYFGPFFGGVNVKDVIEIIKSAFGIRACRGNKWPKNHRVCLNFHIGLCSGACEGKISTEEYRARLDQACAFLNGNDDTVDAMLKERMRQASKELLYEQALVYRDRLAMLERIGARLLVNMPKDTNMDVFGYATDNTHASVCVHMIRGGKTIGSEKYPIIDASLSAADCIQAFLLQYYDGTRMLPQEVLVQETADGADALREYLAGKYSHAFSLTAPKIGVKKSLVENAVLNASDFLTKSIDAGSRKLEMTVGAVEQLQEYLHLKTRPRRMECYDISNISGTDKVASMVVFFDGAADKPSYRRFKIKTVVGANDFASMKEVLSRRLAHIADAEGSSFGERPDLIVVDGGKGQLSSSVEAMRESGYDVQLISLAKREEEVFVPDRSDPVILPRNSYALKLLQRIRDEAHRFAITYHRALRSNRYLSQLEDIPNIGKTRRLALMSQFKSVEAIKAASVEELCLAEGINKKVAEGIVEFFRKKAESAEAEIKNPVLPKK